LTLLVFIVIGPDLYENIPPSRSRPSVYGGHTVSVAIKAALLTLSQESASDKVINSVQSSFVRPVRPLTSVTYKVYNKKDGALFSHRSVSAVQEGKLVFTCLVSFKSATGDSQTGKLIYNNQEKPSIPGPDHPDYILSKNHESYPIIVKLLWPHKNEAGLPTLPTLPKVPRSCAWIKPKKAVTSQDQNDNRIWILYESDTILSSQILPQFPDVKFTFYTSLDHSVWFSDSPYKIDANDWYLYDACCLSSNSHTSLNTLRVYSKDGELVATAVQQAYIQTATAKL
ncbi:PREDICTED: uncharacterized protein LOC105316569, partial [Amphimedon queenslandica]|uniref:Acyl-CoA thioesterase II domain-containing protein n=1 Tax=Amphimedon queenslandica TaxID=400682 RepID=A0AAN0K4W0_AMPQE